MWRRTWTVYLSLQIGVMGLSGLSALCYISLCDTYAHWSAAQDCTSYPQTMIYFHLSSSIWGKVFGCSAFNVKYTYLAAEQWTTTGYNFEPYLRVKLGMKLSIGFIIKTIWKTNQHEKRRYSMIYVSLIYLQFRNIAKTFATKNHTNSRYGSCFL